MVGLVTIGITVHCYKKKYGLSWTFCNKNDDEDPGDMEEVAIGPLDPSVQQ